MSDVIQTSKSLNKSIRAALQKEELQKDSRGERLHPTHHLTTVVSYEEKRPVTTAPEGKRRVSTAVHFRKLPGSQASQRRHINIEYQSDEDYHAEAQRFCDSLLKSENTSESYQLNVVSGQGQVRPKRSAAEMNCIQEEAESRLQTINLQRNYNRRASQDASVIIEETQVEDGQVPFCSEAKEDRLQVARQVFNATASVAGVRKYNQTKNQILKNIKSK